MRYLLSLPVRMAKAAVLVPLRDLDEKVGLSRSTAYIDWWADSFHRAPVVELRRAIEEANAV